MYYPQWLCLNTFVLFLEVNKSPSFLSLFDVQIQKKKVKNSYSGSLHTKVLLDNWNFFSFFFLFFRKNCSSNDALLYITNYRGNYHFSFVFIDFQIGESLRSLAPSIRSLFLKVGRSISVGWLWEDAERGWCFFRRCLSVQSAPTVHPPGWLTSCF